MTIYIFNRGTVNIPSGVEAVVKSRFKMFREMDDIGSAKLVLNQEQPDNHYPLADCLASQNFPIDDVISLYHHFTDVKLERASYTVEKFEKDNENLVRQPTNRKFLLYKDVNDDKVEVRVFLYKDDTDILLQRNLVRQVNYIYDGILQYNDNYVACKEFTNYFTPKTDTMQGMVTHSHTDFYNTDGSIAYTRYMVEEVPYYHLADGRRYVGKNELFSAMIDDLNLGAGDVCLLDRAEIIWQKLYKQKNARSYKVGLMVHSDHKLTDYDTFGNVYWNNNYELHFRKANGIDFVVCPSEIQAVQLRKDLLDGFGLTPDKLPVFGVPYASTKELKDSEDRKPFSIITSGRLAVEKGLPIAIKAVALAHKEVPEITFDVYGSGLIKNSLEKLIQQLDAEEYITLKGHTNDILEKYKDYELYLTASPSEAFATSMMESMVSGTAFVGFDVPYGNWLYVEHEKNGYLVPRDFKSTQEEQVKLLADAIVKYFRENKQEEFRKYSYKKSDMYLEKNVMNAWRNILSEVNSL